MKAPRIGIFLLLLSLTVVLFFGYSFSVKAAFFNEEEFVKNFSDLEGKKNFYKPKLIEIDLSRFSSAMKLENNPPITQKESEQPEYLVDLFLTSAFIKNLDQSISDSWQYAGDFVNDFISRVSESGVSRPLTGSSTGVSNILDNIRPVFQNIQNFFYDIWQSILNVVNDNLLPENFLAPSSDDQNIEKPKAESVVLPVIPKPVAPAVKQPAKPAASSVGPTVQPSAPAVIIQSVVSATDTNTTNRFDSIEATLEALRKSQQQSLSELFQVVSHSQIIDNLGPRGNNALTISNPTFTGTAQGFDDDDIPDDITVSTSKNLSAGNITAAGNLTVSGTQTFTGGTTFSANVGILRANPSVALEVVGTTTTSGINILDRQLYIGNGLVATSSIYGQYGRLGFGSTTPYGQVSIEAVQGVAGSSTPIFVIGDSGTNTPFFIVSGNNGYIGLGTSSPQEKFSLQDVNIFHRPGAPVALGGVDIGDSIFFFSVAGDYLYGVGNPTSADFVVINVADPYSPVQVGSLDLGTTQSLGIDVAGSYAYVGRATNGGTCSGSTITGCEFSVIDISDPSDPTAVVGVNIGNDLRKVVVSGRYAYVGASGSTGTCSGTTVTGCEFIIFDVSNPNSPRVVSGVNLDIDGTGTVWDIEISGQHAFISKDDDSNGTACTAANYANCNVLIWNIANVASTTFVGAVGDTDFSPDARNIHLSGRYLYVALNSVNGTTCNTSTFNGCEFRVYNVSNPASPSLTGVFDVGAGVVSLAVRGRYAYIGINANAGTCSGITLTGCELAILDLTDPSVPEPMVGVNIGSSAGGTDIVISGRHLYYPAAVSGTCSGTTITGCEVAIFDIGGAEISSAEIHSLDSWEIQVRNNLTVSQKITSNSLNLGTGGLLSWGPIAVSGTTTVDDFVAANFGGHVGIGTTSPYGLLSIDFHPSVDLRTPAFVVQDQGTSSPSLLVDYAGNVGIGTSSPGQRLSVGGDGLFKGGLYVQATTTVSSLIATSTLSVGSSTISGAYQLGLTGNAYFEGGLSVGTDATTSPGDIRANLLHSNTQLVLGGIISCTDALETDAAGVVKCGTDPVAGGDLQDAYISSAVDGMIQTSDGKDIVFDIEDTTTDANVTVTIEDTSGGFFAVQSRNASGAATTTRFLVNRDGSTGIGTTSPGGGLAVHGTTTILGGNLYVQATTTVSSLIATSTFEVRGASGADFVVFDGRIGIGDQVPEVALQVVGTTSISSGLDIYGSQFYIGNGLVATSSIYGQYGNLGFGSTSPYGQVSIEAVQGVVGSSTPIFVIGDQGTSSPLFVVSGVNGNVGISSSTPGTRLDVAGNGLFKGGLYVQATTTVSSLIATNTIAVASSSPGSSINLAVTGNSVFGGTVSITGIVDAQSDVYANRIIVPAGSLAAPSIALTSSPTTGIYFPATDQIDITLAGTVIAQFNTGGIQIDTASVIAGNGSPSFVSYGFTSDIDTGIYRSGADSLAFVTAGVRRAIITASGNIDVVNDIAIIGSDINLGNGISATSTISGQYGNLGFGSTSPYGQVSIEAVQGVVGSSTPIFVIGDQGTSSPLIQVDYAGNVSIGSSSPGTKFEVAGGGLFKGGLYVQATTTVSSLIATSTLEVRGSSGADLVVFDGRVGIGDQVPEVTLQVVGTTSISSGLDIYGSQFYIGNGLVATSSIYGQYGKLGFGSTSPYGQVSIEAVQGVVGSSTPIFVIGDQGTGTPIFQVSGNNGYIGVGSSSPWGRFSVEILDTGDESIPSFVVGDTGTSSPALAVYSSGITVIDRLETGVLTFETNAGAVTWVDLSVTGNSGGGSGAAWGTIESYSAQIDATSTLTVYAESDGKGGVHRERVGIGTTTPGGALAVHAGTSTHPALYVFQNETTGEAIRVQTRTDSAALMLQGDGDFGLATVTPGYRFAAGGDGLFKGGLYVQSTTTTSSIIATSTLEVRGFGGSANPDFSVVDGRVGISTSSPQASLGIMVGSSSPGIIIQTTGNTGDGTIAIAVDANAVCEDGSVDTACALNDLAELYPYSEVVEKGDIVQFDGENPVHIKKANFENREKLAGAVSHSPAIIFEGSGIKALGGIYQWEENKAPLALAGRIPVKVSLDNGPIMIGDPITVSSTTPGIGVKAVSSGKVIGYALENYVISGEGTKKILVFANLGYWQSPDSDNSDSSLITQIIESVITAVREWLSTAFVTIKEIATERLAALKFTIGNPEKPTGITIYDLETRQPYCFVVRGGQPESIPGECSFDVATPAPVPEPIAEPAPTPAPEPTLDTAPAPAPNQEPAPEPAPAPESVPSEPVASEPAPSEPSPPEPEI